jgi:hypothetical protein
MTLRTRKHLLFASFAIAVVCLLPNWAAAQQVTYYDFDGLTPSYTCTASSAGSSLFCFNNTTGEGQDAGFPLLFQDTYPPFVDPNPSDPPNTISTHTTLQISDGGSEYSSAWFAVPQKVLNGFTAYVAFRLTPPSGVTPGDGIAFVIQNASGGGSDENDTNDGTCVAVGSGLDISATIGGCLGYGGIDNSLAVEFDTFKNDFDPNNNHIAMQSCGLLSGVGQPNSPSHAKCPVTDLVTSAPAINTDLVNSSLAAISLSDGSVHQAVIEYSGASGATPNQWQVFIDPPFVTGTHTPCTAADVAAAGTGCTAAATAAITTTADLTHYMTLQNSGSATDSAYVGFTGASGGAVENQEILAWTFTPHTVATQQQPLQPAGTPTIFPFGNHTYAVTYETGNTSNVEMVVSAITISPTDFEALVAGTSFAGSECQMYDGTGGNCIVYSASCFQLPLGNPPTAVVCPPTDDPSTAGIDIKTAFENTIQPTTPGLVQGDPLLSPIASISGNGSAATVTCTGECATTVGQTVRILSNADSGFNVTAVVTSTPEVNSFTFVSTDTNTDQAGGFVTSNNLQNIFVSYSPQTIDGTVTGHAKSFSEFVATSVTAQASSLTSPASATFTAGLPGTFTVTALGTPIPSLTQGGVALPNGLTFVDNHDGTGTLSGIPAAGTANTYIITFTAHNTAGPDAVQQPFTLTVLPAVLQSIAVTPSPASVPAGRTLQFVATGTYSDSSTQVLTGGVTWNSSSTGVATIAAGGLATGVTAGSTTNITAALLGVTSPASVLSVTAPVLTSIAVTPTSPSIIAGQTQSFTAIGTYSNHSTQNLTGSATWASTNISAATIAPGGVATGVAPGSTNITATLLGVASPAVTLTVTGQLSVLPGNLPFGVVDLTSRTDLNLAVKNVSASPLKITDIYFNYGPGSGKDYGYFTQCGGTLKAGQSCSIRVELFAQDLGPGSAVLGIAYNLAGSPALVNLSGTVINPKAKLSASQLSFGTQKENTSSTKTVILTSTGTTPLLIQNVSVSGSTDFKTSTCPASLAVNASCTITVTFDPSAKTTRSGTLTITDNALSSPQTVSLSGKGN